MPLHVTEFMRFSAPDADALARSIEQTRAGLEQAHVACDTLASVDLAGDLGSMLTTARREAEALRLLHEHVDLAESLSAHEPAGWFWNAYATALQYNGKRAEADCRSAGWSRLQSFVLHHWGRSLAEQERFDEAQVRISEALALRVQLNEPRQESSRRALEVLAQLRRQVATGPTRGESAA